MPPLFAVLLVKLPSCPKTRSSKKESAVTGPLYSTTRLLPVSATHTLFPLSTATPCGLHSVSESGDEAATSHDPEVKLPSCPSTTLASKFENWPSLVKMLNGSGN